MKINEEISFKDFEKGLRVKYRSERDWEIFLPFNTTAEKLQKIISRCQENLLIDWHIIISDSTSDVFEPEIRMYWDRGNVH